MTPSRGRGYADAAAYRRQLEQQAAALQLPTGGRTPLAEAVARCGFHAVVFDAEQGPVRLGLSRELARRMNAPCLPLGK